MDDIANIQRDVATRARVSAGARGGFCQRCHASAGTPPWRNTMPMSMVPNATAAILAFYGRARSTPLCSIPLGIGEERNRVEGFLVGAAVTMGCTILDLVIGPEIDANFIHVFIASALGWYRSAFDGALAEPRGRS